MNLTLTTPPAQPALATADARAHLRTATTEDAYLEGLIAVATAHVEQWLGRALVNRTYTYKLDAFPKCDGPIDLPYPPLVSVTSVTFRDTATTTDTLSSSTEYEVVTDATPGQVQLRYGQTWPQALDQPQSVTIVYVAGYGANESLIPAPIRHALKLLVGHLYENREATTTLTLAQVPMGIEALLLPYRCWTRF